MLGFEVPEVLCVLGSGVLPPTSTSCTEALIGGKLVTLFNFSRPHPISKVTEPFQPCRSDQGRVQGLMKPWPGTCVPPHLVLCSAGFVCTKQAFY